MKEKKTLNRDKNVSKYTDTDSIIDNLRATDEASMDGNFINDEGNGSFSNINTPICGGEVDVDDL